MKTTDVLLQVFSLLHSCAYDKNLHKPIKSRLTQQVLRCSLIRRLPPGLELKINGFSTSLVFTLVSTASQEHQESQQSSFCCFQMCDSELLTGWLRPRFLFINRMNTQTASSPSLSILISLTSISSYSRGSLSLNS